MGGGERVGVAQCEMNTIARAKQAKVLKKNAHLNSNKIVITVFIMRLLPKDTKRQVRLLQGVGQILR